jgi:hypothetical protein
LLKYEIESSAIETDGVGSLDLVAVWLGTRCATVDNLLYIVLIVNPMRCEVVNQALELV